jgi:hypothetical protein
MDTTGHHSIARAVGEAYLIKAIGDANQRNADGSPLRITSFYLGNWLTDVSQPVDPRAYRDLSAGIKWVESAVGGLFNRWWNDAPSWMREAAGWIPKLDKLRELLRDLQGKFEDKLKKWLELGEKGELAKRFKHIFRFMGYVKFVLDDKAKPTKMDKAVFDGVIDADYTQYFPYEHLDRPAEGKTYASDKADKPLNKRTRSTPQKTDLYVYLRRGIKIAAGHFAALDGVAPPDGKKVSWAVGTFHAGYKEFTDADGKQQPITDTNLAWNLGLARFGHALHAVEDFFAHSTFVEHAMPGLPLTYNRVQRWVDSSNVLGYEVLARRLKEWKADYKEEEWKKLADDPCIVTGYFDTRDTICSLIHAATELFHWPTETPDKQIDDALEYDYKKILTDTLDFVTDPKKAWEDPANDSDAPGYDEKKANVIVDKLKKKNEDNLKLAAGEDKTINVAVQIALDLPLIKDLPADIKSAFENGVRDVGQLVGVAGLGMTIYGTLKELELLIMDPFAWAAMKLPEFVVEHLKEYGAVYFRRLIEVHLVGSLRIGCHSLIAKDTGPELLHDAAMDCAKAVHWYVVYQMARHGRVSGQGALVARGTDGRKEVNPFLLFQGLDWLELLEYYLAHPFASVGVSSETMEVPVSIIHVTKPGGGGMSSDTIGKLGKHYVKTAVLEAKARMKKEGLEFWELIADENFPTRGMSRADRQKTINRVLRHQGTGVLVSDGVNEAFKPNLQLVIPYQKGKIPAVNVPEGKRLWWQPVIQSSWDMIRKWYADRNLSNAPDRLHVAIPVPWPEQKAFVDDATKIRKDMEKQYNQGS